MGLIRVKAGAPTPPLVRAIPKDVNHDGVKAEGDASLFNQRQGRVGIPKADPVNEPLTSGGWRIR